MKITKTKIKNLLNKVMNHWQYGGIRQVKRLIHGIFIQYCGEWYFRGNDSKERYCPICGWEGRRFKPYYAEGYTSLDVICPECTLAPRHRGHLYYYQNTLKLFEKCGKVLYFAPERGILSLLKEVPALKVETSEYETYGDIPASDHNYDIMNIDVADCVFDFVICHRVIEHVPDDRKAMRELYRILKPGGIAVISVPLSRARQKTLEYGKPNPLCDYHYYEYGSDFTDRIPIDFKFKEYLFSELFDKKTIKHQSLHKDDSIFECRRPL